MKNPRLVLIVLTALSLNALPSFGLDQDYGLQVGSSGSGLVGRWWNGSSGFELTMLPSLETQIWGSRLVRAEAGAAALVLLHDGPWSRFYGFAGGSGGLTWEEWWGWRNHLTPAAGFGIEVVLFDHLTLDFRAGLGAELSVAPEWFQRFGVTYGVGISYRLKGQS